MAPATPPQQVTLLLQASNALLQLGDGDAKVTRLLRFVTWLVHRFSIRRKVRPVSSGTGHAHNRRVEMIVGETAQLDPAGDSLSNSADMLTLDDDHA